MGENGYFIKILYNFLQLEELIITELLNKKLKRSFIPSYKLGIKRFSWREVIFPFSYLKSDVASINSKM